MRFCAEHWALLRGAVAAQGLTHLVSPDGDVALRRFQAMSREDFSPEDFDPLLWAHNALVKMVVHMGGAEVLGPRDGHPEGWCPLCYMVENGGAAELERYVALATDGALTRCRELGLVSVS